jgi:DNA-binding Lrp family transcriptional regulator
MRRAPLPPDALDDADRALIDAAQDPLPLTPAPFAALGARLGLSEADTLARLRRLLDIGALTRFGPFLDAAAMGGAFCLCAMAVPEERFEAVAEAVNALPEVAHNYARAHALNMWFVLATETPDGIARACDRIEAATGLTVLRFPKEAEFFVGFRVEAAA